jgi:hypothetical protein
LFQNNWGFFMPIQTITEVVASLQKIVQQCKVQQNRSGYFAALYLRMTQAVQLGIQQGMFEDGPRMEKLDVIFAKRYLDAFAAHGLKQKCSGSWQYAFDGCNNESLTVIQQLLLGINTHINLDLAIAAAQTCPGAGIHQLEHDFNRINDVIAALFDDVQRSLEAVWWPMKWITRLSNGKHEAVLNFSIDAARKTAWANASILANMNAVQQTNYIDKMDLAVKAVAQRIINPGLVPAFTLKMIRQTEYEDIARTINLIETTEV